MNEMIDAIREVLNIRNGIAVDLLTVKIDNDGCVEILTDKRGIEMDTSIGTLSYTKRDSKYYPWEKSMSTDDGKIKICSLLTNEDMKKEIMTEEEEA